jgi:cytochrome c oxidase assembly protein subunit 15
LVLLQITLGAWTIWSNKAADIATAHVAIGAITFATGVMISALLLHLRQVTQGSTFTPDTIQMAEATTS